MTNINLLESAQGKKTSSGPGLGKALSVPIIVLVAILAVWGGTKICSSYFLSQKNKVEEQNKLESANLSGKSIDRLVDFDERMRKSLEESSEKVNQEDYLRDLESAMITGSNIDSLKYSDGKIEVLLVADNFKTVARQILSFKNSKYFKDLRMDKTSRDEDGKIKYTLLK